MNYISKLDVTPLHNLRNLHVKQLAIMGSTGTIGQNTLAIVRNAPHLFSVNALAAGKNIDLLVQDALEFRPSYLAVQEEKDVDIVHTRLKNASKSQSSKSYSPYIAHGQKAYAYLAGLPEIDVLVSAQVGAAGLRATVAAVQAGKTVCLANKESLVLAGDLIRFIAQKSGAIILPVDSEHYAIFQCLSAQYVRNQGAETQNSYVKKLILTASGGPFRGKDKDFLKSVTKEDALRHPNWSMGAKISIDSASLMNKGLELIEACHLYGLSMESVDVLVHPQSIVHSMVEMCDGSILAQLATPDMRLPISACLAWPDVLNTKINTLSPLDLTKKPLSFEEPDTENFPCLNLAKNAFNSGLSIELNAANEIAVHLFLNNALSFMQIPVLIEKTLGSTKEAFKLDYHKYSLEEILCQIEEKDQNARERAKNMANF